MSKLIETGCPYRMDPREGLSAKQTPCLRLLLRRLRRGRWRRRLRSTSCCPRKRDPSTDLQRVRGKRPIELKDISCRTKHAGQFALRQLEKPIAEALRRLRRLRRLWLWRLRRRLLHLLRLNRRALQRKKGGGACVAAFSEKQRRG